MAEDTSPQIITATDLEVRYNEQVVLSKTSLTIGEHDSLGLVGRNGAGKSTLLRILSGIQQPDQGTLTRRRDLVVGYLPQEFALDPALNVLENVRQGASHVLELLHRFESLPPDSKQHDSLEKRITALDGWTLDQRIETAMSQLNLPPPDARIPPLSGGEQRRIALCRAIVSRPDLLILDEPTNHLDPESIHWVAEYLRAFPGAFLLVTHDRWFLDNICTSIIELSNGTCYTYNQCHYEDYLLAKAERQAVEEQTDQKRRSFIRRELEWVRRGAKARRTKAKSRLARFEEAVAQTGPEPEFDVELVIPPPPKLGNRVVELQNVSLTVGDKSLFQDISFAFENGMRIGITGRNGLGKTSLLKLILGQLPPTSGSVLTGPLTQFNYVDQGRIQLNENLTVLQEMGDGTEFVQFGDAKLSLRGYLKRFLFTDDRINTQVRYLSGGERSRLLLARILKNGGNFLVLDEPTNDLDLATLRVLEEALAAFPGCVLVVSHDRYFLNRVCNGILAFEGNGQIHYTPGDYDYYLEKRAERHQPHPSPDKPSPPQNPAPSKRPRKLTWKETRELEGMEERILKTEDEIARLEDIFASPDFHREHGRETQELTDRLSAHRARLAELYARWQELDSIAQGNPSPAETGQE